MLSRVAENVFWMHRYLERAESIARYIDVNFNLILDMPQSEVTQWAPFIQITGNYEEFLERYDEPSQENVIHFLVFDRENQNSLFSCLHLARENARAVRDLITKEMWHEINILYLFVQKAAANKRLIHMPHHFYDRIKRQCHLFTYFAISSMLHTEAWHFGRVGYMLERADQISRLLDVKYFLLLPTPESVGTPHDNIQWAAVLKSASALEMYHQSWHQITSRHVVEFLLLNISFPRSFRFCIGKTQQSLKAISGARADRIMNTPGLHAENLLQRLDLTGVDSIIGQGLHEYIDQMQLTLNVLNESIYDTFFAFTPADL